MGLDGEGGLKVGDEWSRFVFVPVRATIVSCWRRELSPNQYPGSDLRAQMIQPGELLDGFAFKSRHPPGEIRWFVQAVPRGFKGAFPWQCMSAHTALMTGSLLQGTTVGSVPAPSPAR